MTNPAKQPNEDHLTRAQSELASPALSETMLAAVTHAKTQGGCLVRYPGGYWCRDGLMDHAYPWWGTPTVEALVKRGVMEYTEWQEKPHSRFPIRATVKGQP